MKAIFVTGGKQYKVQDGDVLFMEKLGAEVGETVRFDKVVFLSDNDESVIGKPYVEGAVVEAEVLKNAKAKKIRVFKYNAKKNYRRRQGHRQPYTRLQVETING